MSDDEIEGTEEETPFIEEGNDPPHRTVEECDAFLHRLRESVRRAGVPLDVTILVYLQHLAFYVCLVKVVIDRDAVLYITCIALFIVSLVTDVELLPCVRHRSVKFSLLYRRLRTGGGPVELFHSPQSCFVRLFGCSPHWKRYTRYMEHEEDPSIVAFWSGARSRDLSVADTSYVASYCLKSLLTFGMVHSNFLGTALSRRVWTISWLISFRFNLLFLHAINFLVSFVLVRNIQFTYAEAGLDFL